MCGAMLPAFARGQLPPEGPAPIPAPMAAPIPAPRTVQSPSTLAQVVDAAWQRALMSREVDALHREAMAGRAVARRVWAATPSLELSRRQASWAHRRGGDVESEVGWVLPLWMPGQRDAHLASADSGERLAQALETAGRLQMARSVSELAWRVGAERADRQAQREQVELFGRLALDVRRRVAAGDLAPADALAAQAEWMEAEERLAGATQRLQRAQAEWRVLTGLEEVPALPPVSGVGPMPQDGSHPDMQLAERAVEHAQARLDAVDQGRRAAPELRLHVRRDSDGTLRQSQNSVGIGLRVPLGSDAAHAARQASVLSEVEQARAALALTRDRLAAELEAARALQAAAGSQLEASRQRAGLLRQRADLVRQSFEAGEIPLPDLLRAQSAAAQAQTALAQQSAALGLAQARLQHALGVGP